MFCFLNNNKPFYHHWLIFFNFLVPIDMQNIFFNVSNYAFDCMYLCVCFRVCEYALACLYAPLICASLSLYYYAYNRACTYVRMSVYLQILLLPPTPLHPLHLTPPPNTRRQYYPHPRAPPTTPHTPPPPHPRKSSYPTRERNSVPTYSLIIQLTSQLYWNTLTCGILCRYPSRVLPGPNCWW